MPSEVTYGTEDRIDVRVSWSPGIAQMSISHQQGSAVVVEMVNGWLTAAGRDPIDYDELVKAVSEATSEELPKKFGFFATPGRSEINKIIRDLRRARDAAFGRDE